VAFATITKGGFVSSESANRLIKAASFYSSIDWSVLPCHGIVSGRCTCTRPHGEPKEIGKHPAINEWNTQSTSDPSAVTRWWEENPDYNVGVHCQKSGFMVIDIDPRSGGPESFAKFEEIVEGALPPTVEAITGIYTSSNGKALRGRHIFYKVDDSEALMGNLNTLGLKGVDIKHNGYVLIAPSRHFSGVDYEWAPGHAPWEIEMADAPEELLSALRKRSRRSGFTLGDSNWDTVDYEKVDVTKIMEEGITEGSRAVDIYKLTCALANKYGTDDMSRQMIESEMLRFNATKVNPPLHIEGTNGLLHHVHRAIDFVSKNPKIGLISPETAEWMKAKAQKISSDTAEPQQETEQPLQAMTGVVRPPVASDNYYAGTIGGSVMAAIEDGDSIHDATSISNMDVPKDPDALNAQDGGDEGKRSLSDTGNGRRLVDVFGAGVRYTTGLGWFVWKDGYWKPDREDLEVQELAKKIAPIISAEVTRYQDSQQTEVIKWAHQSRSNSRLRGAIDSAKSDPRVDVPVDMWDQDENLLGVLNGVIDLRTGELLKGRPDLHITRRAPVAYTRGHRNVRWEQFIDFATGGDKEYQDWLQRAAGYSITGSNKYDLMFLVYGPAGSGKNTFVEALVKALGTQQYAWPLDSSILAANDGQSNSTDLYHWAQLRGRRVVWVDELPDSERMKENSVKKLTGSSEISARSPGEQPFTFQSQAKLWVSTNHRPVITDDAMWRRIRPIPFTRVPEVMDPDLKEYIFDPEGALPAVLSWAVEGAIKLLGSSSRDALGWCSQVAEAADMYRKNEDRIGIFLSEETQEHEGASTPVKSLYGVYRVWSEERGERPLAQGNFQRKMLERNVNISGTGSRAVVHGRTLIPRVVQSVEIDWNTATRFAKNV
jgi:P4 family phage/plasmid primase-like protien